MSFNWYDEVSAIAADGITFGLVFDISGLHVEYVDVFFDGVLGGVIKRCCDQWHYEAI